VSVDWWFYSDRRPIHKRTSFSFRHIYEATMMHLLNAFFIVTDKIYTTKGDPYDQAFEWSVELSSARLEAIRSFSAAVAVAYRNHRYCSTCRATCRVSLSLSLSCAEPKSIDPQRSSAEDECIWTSYSSTLWVVMSTLPSQPNEAGLNVRSSVQ